MKTTVATHGTCASFIDINVEDGILKEMKFIGGCAGNTQGIAALATGRPVTEVIAALKGLSCRNGTSCPDQLALALEGLTVKRVA